ncbi:MAG: enoyl-CoA hydratase/isomerase family protein [Silicimonas sp.]|nr:enoyl-CoA hydratase/isomerase family protein [Silicimonas sp.]
MKDISIRQTGPVGRITLTRPKALNAVTLEMIRELAEVLPRWAENDTVKLIVMDAEGDKAFCAGGDIAQIYDGLTRGDSAPGRQFWREEYPVNALLAAYPKPVVSFLQGFVMGGGVGLGCHVSHPVVGDTSRIAMPECGIGLIPDVGGTHLLSQAPGRLGEFIGTTAYRMAAGDALLAGFADHYIPEDQWPALIAELETTGDVEAVIRAAQPAPEARLAPHRDRIDQHFGAADMGALLAGLRADGDDWAQDTLNRLTPNAPLAMGATLALIRAARTTPGIKAALTREYRYAHRATEQGDFREGIRAAVIDKDRKPVWTHKAPDGATEAEIAAMIAPLGAEELTWEETT